MDLVERLFSVEYLSDEQLRGLDKYVYSAVDTSPLSNYVMHPMWNWMVRFLPTWISPNLMTFCGFACLIAACTATSIVDPDLSTLGSTPVPFPSLNLSQWFWMFVFAMQLLAHNLDGMDGKQARRTGTSSALGELFDHGLDSWGSGLFPLPYLSVVSRVKPWGHSAIEMHFMLWLIEFSFFLSHWEKYNTGILYLPWSYDLSMLLLALCYVLSAFLTPSFVRFFVPVLGIRFCHLIYACVVVGVILFSLPVSVYNVKKAFDRKKQIWNSMLEVMRPFSSVIVLFSASTTWAFCSQNNTIEKMPRMFLFATCTTFSSLTCRLIVAEMSCTKCKPFNLSLIPYLTVLAVSCLFTISDQTEGLILTAYTVYITAAHSHYGACVVRQIAKHYNIAIFKVTKNKSERASGQ